MFNVNKAKVVRSYNGKKGCMCGCMGKYNEANTVATARRLAALMSFVGPVRPVSEEHKYWDAVGYSTKPFGGVCYVYDDRNGRNTTVYFKA